MSDYLTAVLVDVAATVIIGAVVWAYFESLWDHYPYPAEEDDGTSASGA
jgi:hypothetical protein